MIRPIGIAVREIILRLGAAEITSAGGILIPGLLSEEIARHMFDCIETEAVAMRLIERPANGADQHGVDVFSDRIAHVITAIAESPRRDLMRRHGRIRAGIRERLAGLANIML